MDFNQSKNEAISFCEENYPQTTDEFKKMLHEMYEIFCKKSKDYGMDNVAMGTDLSKEEDVKLALTGLWFRKNDKIQRLKQLVVKSNKPAVSESIDDSYTDLSIYAMISRIVSSGNWGK